MYLIWYKIVVEIYIQCTCYKIFHEDRGPHFMTLELSEKIRNIWTSRMDNKIIWIDYCIIKRYSMMLIG